MTIYFYQSTGAVNTPVDHNNPVHVQLAEELKKQPRNRRLVNKLMKQAGMQPGRANDMLPVVRWSCDICLVERGPNGLATGWLTKND